jgi:hypothetical protein
MEKWGTRLYGDPCRACSFSWSLSPDEAVEVVRGVPERYALCLAGTTGHERHADLGWTPVGHTSHVADNLRNWAERLAGAYLAGVTEVPGYDQDLLARARRYDELSIQGALWSLEWAAAGWVDIVTSALAAGVVLSHAGRGRQTAEDVARNNCHDAHHHLWDIERILAAV